VWHLKNKIMYISEISIKNFKKIKELKIIPNHSYNVIIGENNQGKTTIFEALQTWYRCFQLYIRPNRTHFYKGNNLYLQYENLDFLRISRDIDLFTSSPYKAFLGLTISDTDISGKLRQFNLEFEINRPRYISNAYLRILKRNNNNFLSFAEHLRNKNIKLDDAIFLYQTNPIARVLAKEPFMNEGQIRKKIKRGKSQEVLRSKILLHRNKEKLERQVSDVLGKQVKFDISNINRRDKDEYINLQVTTDNKTFEIYLQGSGLIQITEIFATVDYLASKLNILLIDEPDSHIHLNLQKKLMDNLRKLTDSQIFIISHNDSFISQINNGELFYLNNDAIVSKELTPIDDADLIKRDFGSPIKTLESLNNADNIVFVEGNDDKKYIEKLLQRIQESSISIDDSNLKSCFFFQIRGKDNLINKLDHNKRTLSQLFRDKTYIVVTDKDFATISLVNSENSSIQERLGSNSKAFSHDGYCIESTLFSELDKLHNYIAHISNTNIQTIERESENFLNNLLQELTDVHSDLYRNFEKKFNSQKRNRSDLSQVLFSDVLRDSTQSRESLKNIMNKELIREYITTIESNCSITIVENGASLSNDKFCNKLFNDYIDKIPQHNILFESLKMLISEIYNVTFE